MTKVTSWQAAGPVRMSVGPGDRSAGGPPGRRGIIDRQASAERQARALDGFAASAADPSATRDEATVVRAVLDGDRDAFRILVDRELPGIVRAATRILSDASEGEDVAQEAFVIAYRSLGSWRADGPFGAWLARIAVRLAIRRASRRRALPWVQPGHVIDDDGPALAAQVATTDPERAAVRGEQARQVRLAVASLEEPYREVVALRFFADRSLDEIAAITGRPLGTVKTHLRRGLIRLRAGIDAGSVA